MELIDNYLAAVTGYLPRDSREDIGEELKSSLYEQIEEQSGGREPTEEEQVEFLRKLGHPLKVAGQYMPQRFLIGPSLYPFYLNALKITALIVFVIHTALSVVRALITDDWISAVSHHMSNILGTFTLVGAIVTVVFVVMERSGESPSRFYKWDPWTMKGRGRAPLASRGDMVPNVIIESVLLLWWNGAFNIPWMISWNTSTVVTSSPGLEAVFWPVNVVLVGSLILHGMLLIHPVWKPSLITLEIAFDVASLGIVGYLLRFETPVTIQIMSDLPVERLQEGVDIGIQTLLWFILVITLVELVKHLRIAIRVARNTG